MYLMVPWSDFSRETLDNWNSVMPKTSEGAGEGQNRGRARWQEDPLVKQARALFEDSFL